MAVPPPSPIEHLQSTLRKFYNREAREWFGDVDLDNADISIPRQSMALACRHLDDDSFIVTISRQLFFESLKNRFSANLEGIGETTFRDDVRRRLHPKITLVFLEDLDDVADGFIPVYGQISIRLMDYEPATITETIARNYAIKIKTAFASGNGFVWRKGKKMITYSDWAKGYQLQLLCRDENEGRRVIEQVLDINDDQPVREYTNIKVNDQPSVAFPTIPSTERIYGENRKQKRRRPLADVRFQAAFLYIQGMPKAITLVDRSGKHLDALV